METRDKLADVFSNPILYQRLGIVLGLSNAG